MLLSSPLIETSDLAAWNDDTLRLIETSPTHDSYEAGHIPGSVFWPLNEIVDDYFRLRTDPEHFADLLSRSGIAPETTVVCTFSDDPAAAAWLFWILTSFGHTRTVLLSGGTPKWRAENRPLTGIEAEVEAAPVSTVPPFSETNRATLPRVREATLDEAGPLLLDTRTAAEFCGQHFYDAPPKPGEIAGHIPGALHLPHSALFQDDGTYRSTEELRLFCEDQGLQAERETIVYCAIGARSSAVWFALKHLLGYANVRNYDGSWNEWSRTL